MLYVDDIIINGTQTFKRPFLFSFYFFNWFLIPKESFDLIATLVKDQCGYYTKKNLYELICDKKANLTKLNEISLVVKIKDIYLKYKKTFGLSNDQKQIISNFMTYSTYDGTQGKMYDCTIHNFEPQLYTFDQSNRSICFTKNYSNPTPEA